MPVFIGQIRLVKKMFYQGEDESSPVLLTTGSVIEIKSLPEIEDGISFIRVKKIGSNNNDMKMEWSELEANSEAAETFTEAKAREMAHKIWNNYKEGDKTFSQSLNRYYRRYKTITIAASNSIQPNANNNWMMNEEEFMAAFIMRAQGLPS